MAEAVSYFILFMKLNIFKFVLKRRGPVLWNLDPYSGTLNLTRTLFLVCTQVSEYNTLKKLSYFVFCILYLVFCFLNVLNLISMSFIDALLHCHVSWVMAIESGSKKIDSS